MTLDLTKKLPIYRPTYIIHYYIRVNKNIT